MRPRDKLASLFLAIVLCASQVGLVEWISNAGRPSRDGDGPAAMPAIYPLESPKRA